MNGGSRTTKNNTGLEDCSNNLLTRLLDSANTMQDAYRPILELKHRFAKYRETLGNICFTELERLETKYPNGTGNGSANYHQPEPEPEPVPEPEPEPERLPPLTWDIIQAIEANECEYGPYIREIWESDWDYVDRRQNNTLMRATPDFASDWAYTHKDDTGTISSLSDPQHGLMMVMLKAFHYHKRHPSVQEAAKNDGHVPPPF